MNFDEILLNDDDLKKILPIKNQESTLIIEVAKAAQLKLLEWLHENYFDNATEEHYFMWISKADLTELKNLLKDV